MLYPGAMEETSFFAAPKKHNRRPNSHWDHIIRGADVQSVWVENENGEQERDIDGKLSAYDLRAKGVNPGLLGVDPKVKQYSGYLDDNDNDKHLFYCMSPGDYSPLLCLFPGDYFPYICLFPGVYLPYICLIPGDHLF